MAFVLLLVLERKRDNGILDIRIKVCGLALQMKKSIHPSCPRFLDQKIREIQYKKKKMKSVTHWYSKLRRKIRLLVIGDGNHY